jgi:hypothetical protein
VDQEPAPLNVHNALTELRGIINALLGGQIAGVMAQEMADGIMEQFNAVQIGAAIPPAPALAGQMEEEIEEPEQGDNDDAADLDVAFIGNAILIRHLNPDSNYWDIVDAMKFVGEILVIFFLLHFFFH